jgi:hypothetical protein
MTGGRNFGGMKKWLWRIGLGVPASLVALYLFVMLRSVIPATVPDQGLRLERASIPAGSNAFDVLVEAADELWWPDAQSRTLAELARDTNWDPSLTAKTLAYNRETLAAWDKAVTLPAMQVPEITTEDTAVPYLADWKRLAMLAGVRENALLHNGEDQAAFDQMLNDLQLGRRMQNAHGALIGYLVGVAVTGMTLDQLQHWAGKAHLEPGQLKACIARMAPDPNGEAAAFANAMKTEYQCDIGTLEALRQGKIADSESGGVYVRPRPWAPVYNYSQTRALFARLTLALVAAAPHHYIDANLPAQNTNPPNLVSLILSGNVAGRIFYDMMGPAVIPAFAKKSQADAQWQATRTILALRAYELTHGRLPPDLNALVPEFLEAVPTDDFDGHPLRYAPERKMVYSVGRNLKDDGGDDRRTGPSHQPLDLVYRFDF